MPRAVQIKGTIDGLDVPIDTVLPCVYPKDRASRLPVVIDPNDGDEVHLERDDPYVEVER